MKRVSLAVLSLLGLASIASTARADDFDFGTRDGRARDGVVRGDRDFRDDRGDRDVRTDRDSRAVYVPGHLETRRETVCDPAVYEDRVVPVFEDRRVPVFGEVTVPVFDDRLVPTFDLVLDPRSGRPRRVQIGVRTEHVQIGTRLERRQVGERHEQVQVGTRVEHVLVRAACDRIVERQEWVPGHYVAGWPAEHDRYAFDRR